MFLSPQEEDKGKGNTDGTYQHKTLFTCPKDCGIFVPFSRLRPVIPTSSSAVQLEKNELLAGDRVTYFITDKCRHGMVVDVKEKAGQTVVQISTVSKTS